MPVQRISPPLHLPGATEFSADRDVLSALWLVKTLKQTKWLYNDLEKATLLDKNWGRRKEPGSWALAYLAFVVSDCRAAVEKWWAEAPVELWRECGFARRPSYQTTYERFVELECVADEFAKVASKLIQHCKKHESQIGAHVHIDGTEAETHAAPVHDCQPGEGCQWGGAKPSRTAKRPRRVSTDVVRAERQRDADDVPNETPNIGEADEVKEMPDGRLRFRIGQHWYRTLDATAGVRAYMGARGARRFWHGYYNIKSIDHYTGAPLAIGIYSASKNEHTCYPDLFERLQTNIGGNPESIVADKGFSIEAVFAHNTNNGVASVIPWRKGKGRLQRQDFDTHDRHGIPRCKHCGAETEFIRFRVEKGGPRLWFRCLNQANRTPAACARIQSITCKTDYRLLLPLWRTEPIYHELASSHSQYERVHRHWRERYLVAGDNLATRPKRRGIGCQELRAQAALLAEWLRISWREGWLGSARRNKKSPARYASFGVTGSRGLKKFRLKAGLRVPYGQQAALLGLGEATPPSRRVAAPPGDPPDYGGVPF